MCEVWLLSLNAQLLNERLILLGLHIYEFFFFGFFSLGLVGFWKIWDLGCVWIVFFTADIHSLILVVFTQRGRFLERERAWQVEEVPKRPRSRSHQSSSHPPFLTTLPSLLRGVSLSLQSTLTIVYLFWSNL